MAKTTIEKSFCTTREAADLLGVSVGTIQLWVESGLLRAWKTTGGHRRVMRDSIDNILHKAPEPPAPPAAPPRNNSGNRPLQVMVVEDDPILLRLYETRLAGWPMPLHLTAMGNAYTALMAVGRNAPDLLISDLHMSGVDGFAMLWALHGASHMATTTIVVVSGLTRAEIAQRGGVPPGIEILPKPIPFDRLQEIARQIERSETLPSR
jgi:excisionase family DNA binding protein